MYPTCVLFVLKAQDGSGSDGYSGSYSEACHYGESVLNRGLYFSARYIVDMLNENDVDARLVQVLDGDFIDREIVKYQPTDVVLEALWVTPAKLDELIALHPEISWTVRIHSEIPFLAQESIAIDWINKYFDRGVTVAFNSSRSFNAFRNLYLDDPLVLLPDYFPVQPKQRELACDGALNISCFGSLRVMKNQLNQAVAAIRFGDETGQPIRFHINNCFHGCNTGRSILNNLRQLFESSAPHRLVEHEWLSERDFQSVLSKMDIGMQVSFSESFNIVSAQTANFHIPIVVSDEIVWASGLIKACPTSISEMVAKLKVADSNILGPLAAEHNLRGLKRYSKESEKLWLQYYGN